MPLQVKEFVTGPFEVNSYLISDLETKQAFIVDPGHSPFELIDFIETHSIVPQFIFNTHGHVDHIGGNKEICDAFDIHIRIGEKDAGMLTNPVLNLSSYLDTPVISPEAGVILKEGDSIGLGENMFNVIETPGHTQGSISIYNDEVLLSGDVLFLQSIGRSDFPGSSHEILISSIKNKLLILPGKTRVLSGHGPETTIENEKKYNPFLR